MPTISVTEAASDIGVHRTTILKHNHDGNLGASRTGFSRRSWLRIEAGEWERFKRALAVETPAALPAACGQGDART